MHKVLDKRVSNILKQLKASNNLIPQIVLIGKNKSDADSKNRWVISETYYISGKYSNKKMYVDEYKTYLDKLNEMQKQIKDNKTAVVIIDDLSYCN